MVRPDLHLPPSFLAWLSPFLAAFSRRTRPTAAALAAGALLAVRPRTVTNCLRALGLAEHPSFTAFHRVLNRNSWSGLALAHTLLRMAVATFVPSGPIVIGIDHTLERRRGPCIGPAGRFYDASRRADMPKPTSRGLRWLSAMLLVDVPFAGRIWALPVLTALTPSKTWSERHGRRHRTTTEWARLMLLTLRRWLPDRPIVAGGDGDFAVLELLHALRPSMVVITRMRKDARLFDPPPRHDDKPGRAPSKGKAPAAAVRVLDRPGDALATGCAIESNLVAQRGLDRVHPRHRPVAPRRQADRANPVGAGALPRRAARAGSLSVHGHRGEPARRAGLLQSPLGRRDHLLRKPVPTSGWKRSANGPIRRSSAQRRCCSAFTPSSPFMLTCMPIGSRSRHGGLPGIRNRPRRLPTRSRACAGTFGSSGSSPRSREPT